MLRSDLRSSVVQTGVYVLTVCCVMQAISRGYRVARLTNARHRPAVFPRPHDQDAAEPIPAERVGPRGGAVHAAHHLQLLAEPAQQDLRHDPVLAESDSVLVHLGLLHQLPMAVDRQQTSVRQCSQRFQFMSAIQGIRMIVIVIIIVKVRLLT